MKHRVQPPTRDEIRARQAAFFTGKKRLRKRAARKPYPRGEELLFRAEMRKLFAPLLEYVRKEFLPEVSRLTDERGPVFRKDAVQDDLDAIFLRLRTLSGRVLDRARVGETLRKVATSISRKNLIDTNSQLKSTLGIEVFSDRATQQQVELFVASNVGLVESVEDDMINRLRRSVYRNAMRGGRIEDLSDEIKRTIGVTESKADFLARDQTAKLNGELTELRQRSVGVSKYIWSTSLDERVRPDHAEREGEVFDWDSPPEGGHPGEDYNCRCVAIPVFDGEE